MSRTMRIRPTGAAALIGAVIGAVALSGCGAGQISQTSDQVAAVAGANGGAGGIAVRDVQIEFAEDVEGADVYPRGAAAPLRMTIVNSGFEADRLVSVSSPVASSVEIVGDAGIPGGRALAVEGEAPDAATSLPLEAAEEPGATAAPEPTAPEPTASAPTTSAPTASAGGTGSETHVVLTGLREDIRAGLTYPVVFSFERAGDVRLEVPVGNPAAPREDAQHH